MTDAATVRNRKVQLGAISETPSAYTEDATFLFPGGTAELHYTYEYAGSLRQAGIKFVGVRAYSYRAESQCTPWHIDDAYDELVQVINSDWLAKLTDSTPEGVETMRDVRHFLVYIDGSGAFEIAAKGHEWLESGPATDG